MTVPDFDPNSPTFFSDTKAATRALFRELLADGRLSVFAFATSSLRGVPIQFALVEDDGQAMTWTISTTQPLDPGSQAFHGLSQVEVDDGAPLSEMMSTLREYLGEGNRVITFSPDFFREALVRACRLEGVEMFGASHWLDGQALLSTLVGSYNWTANRWSKPKLTDCIRDLEMPGDFAPIGTALGNAQRLHALLKHFAQEPDEQPRQTFQTCERCGLADDCTCHGDVDPEVWS